MNHKCTGQEMKHTKENKRQTFYTRVYTIRSDGVFVKHSEKNEYTIKFSCFASRCRNKARPSELDDIADACCTTASLL